MTTELNDLQKELLKKAPKREERLPTTTSQWPPRKKRLSELSPEEQFKRSLQKQKDDNPNVIFIED